MGFVVEGFNDEKKVKQVIPYAYVVVTKRTRFNNRVKMDINKIIVFCDYVFLLTDPDEAGDMLSRKLLTEFPSLEKVYLDKDECLCYRNNRLKIGVEHCTNQYLSFVLNQYLNSKS